MFQDLGKLAPVMAVCYASSRWSDYSDSESYAMNPRLHHIAQPLEVCIRSREAPAMQGIEKRLLALELPAE